MIPELWLIILLVALLAAIMSGMPVMLAIAGVPVLVAVLAASVGDFDLSYFGAFPQRVFGIMDNTLLVAVPLFILMGILLERSKVAERMLLMMASFLGGSRHGLVYSVLIVSALIAASTGIIGATIVMLTMICLPALLKAGVPQRLASGLICSAGTLGQIIPPSIVLILLGDQISNAYLEAQRNQGNFAPDPVSVGDLFAGALIPGFMLVLLYAGYIFLHSRIFKAEDAAEDKQTQEVAQLSVTSGTLCTTFFPPLLLIVAVLGSILMGVATATEAAAVGVAGTLLIAAANSDQASIALKGLIIAAVVAAFSLSILLTLQWSTIDFSSGQLVLDSGSMLALALSTILLLALLFSGYRLLQDRAMTGNKQTEGGGQAERTPTESIMLSSIKECISVSGMVFAIIIAASMLSLVFRGFEGDEWVAELLSAVPGDKWGALLAVMLVIFLLGFVLEFVEIVFIVIPIVGPVLLAMDFHPVWFAVMIAINLQTSFLTPPFGFALFYYRSVAPSSIRTSDIYLSVIPFILIQILAMAILVAFPELVTWLPDIMG